jgi:hypothetical protein
MGENFYQSVKKIFYRLAPCLAGRRASHLRCFSPLFVKATLYTQVGSNFSGLKGLNLIAQGRVSGGTIRNATLGYGWRMKTVREIMLFKMGITFRTEPGQFFAMKLWDIPFRPNIGLLIGVHFRADDFVSAFPTRGDTPSSFAVRLSSRRSPGLSDTGPSGRFYSR